MDLKKIIEQSVHIDRKALDFFYDISTNYSELGNIEKAISIKEILLSFDLENSKREEIMLSLARDFHKAGMYDNALSVLEDIFLITENKDQILDMQSHIYSELKEWNKVLQLQKMKKIKDLDFILFALCNFSKEVLEAGDVKKAQLLLKEAELIDKNHPHVLLHWIDIFLKEKNLDEILKIGEKISNESPNFFGVFLEKIARFMDKNIFQLAVNHIKNKPDDYYTLFIFSKILFEMERYRDIFLITRDIIAKGIKIPALVKIFLQSLEKVKEEIDLAYFNSIISNLSDNIKWFKCSNCGQELEIYSFCCIRCSSLNSLKPLW